MAMKVIWYETSSAYYVQAEDGRTACIGDGVDLFFDGNDDPVYPGTAEFNAAMEELCSNPETADAYFGQEVK